jgi:hypothetical protein
LVRSAKAAWRRAANCGVHITCIIDRCGGKHAAKGMTKGIRRYRPGWLRKERRARKW